MNHRRFGAVVGVLAIGLLAATAGCGGSDYLDEPGASDDSGALDGQAGSDATVGADGRADGANDATIGDGAITDGTIGDGAAGDGASGDGAAGDGASRDGASGDAGDAGRDAGDAGRDAGDGGILSCGVFGAACLSGSNCCSQRCDTTNPVGGFGKCASNVSICGASGTPCQVNTDCCKDACVAGVCGATQCLTIGATCPVAGNVCCSGNCTGGKCASVVPAPTCTTAGNVCAVGGDCCSGLCTGGRCASTSSYCFQNGEICARGGDCCGGVCTAASGQPAGNGVLGTCSAPAGGNPCSVSGSVCNGDCKLCCSRLCAPYALTGVSICQPPEGCRLEGDLCLGNADCCGGGTASFPGSGPQTVICSNAPGGTNAGQPLGRCEGKGSGPGTPSCTAAGSSCHYPNNINVDAGPYACPSVTSSNSDCCDAIPPKASACYPDQDGIPRCHNNTGTCQKTGQACNFSGDCCALASGDLPPCLPGPGGQKICGATVCSPSGGTCSNDGDCCPGFPCITPPGSTTGTCSPVLTPPPPPPPPPPPGDGGTGDGGGGTLDGGTGGDSGISITDGGGLTCALYGQGCKSLPCCNTPLVFCNSSGICTTP